MKVVFRVDSSVQIGSGHVMRCLTLAEKLRKEGHAAEFICRNLAGNYIGHIESVGYRVHVLPDANATGQLLDWNSHAAWLGVPWEVDAKETLAILKELATVDWLVVDHYALDKAWERMMRPAVERIMVFDDLVECRHDCDLLLNQNFYRDLKALYAAKVPESARILQGVEYALIRPEFTAQRDRLRDRDGVVREILVFLGGSDQDNVTTKVLQAILILERPDIQVNVVVGLSNPHRDQVESLCRKFAQFHYYLQTDRMAELMASADLCVGAGGATTWERYCLGLPTLLVTMAMNQEEGARFQTENGLVKLLGRGADLSVEEICENLKSALSDRSALMAMTEKGKSLVDGRGVGRVVDEMARINN